MSESMLLWPQGRHATGNGPEDRPRLTPYLPEGKGPFPAIVVCPGGGYGFRAVHEGEPIAHRLYLGIAGFVLDYRVAPYRHPVPLGDAQRAIRLVRAQAAVLNVDPVAHRDSRLQRGRPSGGVGGDNLRRGQPIRRRSHRPPELRPDALVACYAVLTFGEFRHDGSMQTLLGEAHGAEALARKRQLQEYLSLEKRVTPRTPPAFLWHTAEDDCVLVENALLFAGALQAAGVPFSLHVFPRGPHGMGLAQDSPEVSAWTKLCARGCGIGF